MHKAAHPQKPTSSEPNAIWYDTQRPTKNKAATHEVMHEIEDYADLVHAGHATQSNVDQFFKPGNRATKHSNSTHDTDTGTKRERDTTQANINKMFANQTKHIPINQITTNDTSFAAAVEELDSAPPAEAPGTNDTSYAPAVEELDLAPPV